jgi:Flagellar motor protein
MHPHKSTDIRSPGTSLMQSAGGLYLGVVAALLFVVALLVIDRSMTTSRLGQMAAEIPAAPETPAPEERAALYAKLAEIGEDLSAEAAERNRLARRLEELLALRAELGIQAGDGQAEMTAEDVRAALLRAIEETERELAAVSQALDAAERRISTRQIEVAGLGARLNRALLARVEELQKSRSDFFSRLRGVLGDRPGFMVEGDRFALPSEVLFPPGSDRLTPEGVEEVRRLAATINAVRAELPADLAWVLRVGGHTDKRPIATARFPSNWELSAMRAVTVVKTLIAAGIPPQHIAAAGFGEFQPLTTADDDAALARNRRIEFRLDQP